MAFLNRSQTLHSLDGRLEELHLKGGLKLFPVSSLTKKCYGGREAMMKEDIKTKGKLQINTGCKQNTKSILQEDGGKRGRLCVGGRGGGLGWRFGRCFFLPLSMYVCCWRGGHGRAVRMASARAADGTPSTVPVTLYRPLCSKPSRSKDRHSEKWEMKE